jgi:cell division protein ZapB
MTLRRRHLRIRSFEDVCHFGKGGMKHDSYISTAYRLTQLPPSLHNRPMSETPPTSQVDQEFLRLEKRVEELVVLLTQLTEENRALRQRQDSLMTERSSLLQKNEQVRGRVEAMIGRLKAMEHGT